jgi:hypothetical protein
LKNGALQGIGVEVAIGAGVVCDKSFDSFHTDFCTAV